MKAKFLFGSLLATALFCGCSSDEPAVNPDNGGATGEPQFLTVNLVTTGEAAGKSRAPQVGDPNDGKGHQYGSYEEGLAAENQVDNVRFYFFKGGVPSPVKSGSKQNWLEFKPEFDKTQMPNVEKILKAVLILQTPDNIMPETMVAVVNPTDVLSAGTEVTLTSLKNDAANYAKSYTDAGKFVMSNSTYGSGSTGNLKVEMEVSVEGHIKTKPELATQAPVELYVERTVAKVRLGCAETFKVAKEVGGIKLYDPSDPTKSEQKFDGTKIYVKFLGWNATAAADKSRLIKSIDGTWGGTILGETFGPWNWADYHRSFWATNAAGVGYEYGPFQANDDDDNLFQAQAKTKFDKTQWVYLNENAEGATTNTKVIIAAQLVDENGAAIEFAEYAGSRYYVTGDNSLTSLFANNSNIYRRTGAGTADDPYGYTKITPADLTIKTISAIKGEPADDDRYKVYAQLSDEVAAAVDKTIVLCSSNEENAATIDAAAANDILFGLGSAKVWTSGYTYYYFDIEHGVKNGVVRNHIYDADITSLVGLGTPVYDPDEIIYPEKPDPDTETYLAARINILSWRVVKNDIPLQW